MRWLVVACVALAAAACASLNRRDPVDTGVERGEFLDAAASRERRARPDRLRVVTYNVHGEGVGKIAIAIRRSRVLREADVILLQELETPTSGPSSSPRRLAKALGMSFVYAPGYGLSGGGSHGVAIFSRLPLADVGLLELPRFDVHFNSARRVALGATVRMGDAAVRIYSVHLDNRVNPAARRAQIAPVIQDAIRQPVARVIIGGDLNTSPFCWISHVIPVPCGLQTRRLERYVRKHGFDTPVVASGGTAKWLAMRLDGFYTRGLRVGAYGVEDSVRLSDHLPLWLDVSP